ncbi:GGDEF domain-containing protein [Vibrio hippocampi]|uniref:diguanylate cyclase n=1 Tax=Vibrio hippocampi TaxID=654686 RepID=A0ABN8DMW7_9VIBR|nr:GGDEF domain-containing protein [Vibrio hippocampi]CAH0529618.1 hypothetical protein VHP8226_03373 [Vibrio hippocampi]
MSNSLLGSHLVRLLLPIALIIGVLLGLGQIVQIANANAGFSTNLPYILFLTAIALGHTFKQSTMAMVSIAMLVAYFVIQQRLQTPLSTGTTLLEVSLLCLLLPVACCLAYLFPDTGLLNKTMALFIAILASFILWSYLIISHLAQGGFADFSDALLTSVPQISSLPLVLVLYCFAISGATGIFLLKYQRAIDASVYSSVLLASTTFIIFHLPSISSTLFSLAGILNIIYLISASHQMAFNDRLTNIPGRRALEMDMKHLGRRYAIAMLDVDHFKKFNDTYGHDTGDQVLKLVASKLTSVKGNAKVYRYGGEEFTVLFKGKNAADSHQYLDDLRQEIADYQMVLRDMDHRPEDNKVGAAKRAKSKASHVSITISIGVADTSHTRKPNEVLKLADEALYQAKKKGRNCVQRA